MSMSEDGSERISLTERQRERLKAIRAECKEADPDLPAPTDEQLITSLLDTWDAVGEGIYSGSDPFERIKPHRDVLRDIRQMRENLRELEQQVRIHEWMMLGGRGTFTFEQCDKLCEGVEGGMPYIQEAIRELPDPYDTGSDHDA